eukprot:CAMPEP_0117452826 /NCGR_PEP_ID=MMETSP0759-20121206/9850_1 /TAXON_ID=63605 /ORGANISM="Percolomonas cosmopolitus, Strain WS" /LENGTH=193 /DNA_ID=CAMNT_0005245723 /DNA_START=284 /DNA_END=864 /DNA_ORIENTATION=+
MAMAESTESGCMRCAVFMALVLEALWSLDESPRLLDVWEIVTKTTISFYHIFFLPHPPPTVRSVALGRVEESNLFPVPLKYNDYYAFRVCGYFHPEKKEACDNYLREHYDDFYNEIVRRRNRGYYHKLNYTPYEKGYTRPNFVELGSVKAGEELHEGSNKMLKKLKRMHTESEGLESSGTRTPILRAPHGKRR